MPYTTRFSRDRPRFTDTLDVIKFLCKDLWMLVFRKQIDNLKTNHRVCLIYHPSISYGESGNRLSPSGLHTTNKDAIDSLQIGCLRSDGQFVPPIRTHEHRSWRSGCSESTTCKSTYKPSLTPPKSCFSPGPFPATIPHQGSRPQLLKSKLGLTP
jgi:hypothetical protein